MINEYDVVKDYNQIKRVAIDGNARRDRVHRDVLHEEFTIAESRSINSYHILVKLQDFNDNSRLVPFEWMRSCLILDSHVVAGT